MAATESPTTRIFAGDVRAGIVVVAAAAALTGVVLRETTSGACVDGAGTGGSGGGGASMEAESTTGGAGGWAVTATRARHTTEAATGAISHGRQAVIRAPDRMGDSMKRYDKTARASVTQARRPNSVHPSMPVRSGLSQR